MLCSPLFAGWFESIPGALTWLLDHKPKHWLRSNGLIWPTITNCLLFHGESPSPSTMYQRLWELARVSQLYAADAAAGAAAAAGDSVLQGLRSGNPRDWYDAGSPIASCMFSCCMQLELQAGGEAARMELYCSTEFWHVLLGVLLGLVEDLYEQHMQQQRSNDQHKRSSSGSSSSSNSGRHRCSASSSSGDTGSTSAASRASSSMGGRSSTIGRNAARSSLRIQGSSSLSELLLPPDHVEVAVPGGRRAVVAQVAWLEHIRNGKRSGQRKGLTVGAQAMAVLSVLHNVLELHVAAATSSSTSEVDSTKVDDAINRGIGTCISEVSSSSSSNNTRSDASGSTSSRGTASCSARTSNSSSSSSSSNSKVNISSGGGGVISSNTSNSKVSSSSCGSSATGEINNSTSNSEASSSSGSSSPGAPAALHSTGHVRAPIDFTQLLKLLLELIALLGQADVNSVTMASAAACLCNAAELTPIAERPAFFLARGDLLLQVLWLLAEQGSREQQDGSVKLWGELLHKLVLKADAGKKVIVESQ